MKRYAQAEVDAAMEQVERGVFTAHSQIVLAGEVAALRLQYRTAMRCPVHNLLGSVLEGDAAAECWACVERRSLRDRVIELEAQLKAVTDCPGALVGPDGVARCSYRVLKQVQCDGLQRTNELLRKELAQLRGAAVPVAVATVDEEPTR